MSLTSPQGPQYDTGTSAGGYITSSTPGTGTPIPFKAGFTTAPQTTQRTATGLAQDYGNMSENTRLYLSQSLKRAGYSVPVTGKYNAKVRDAFLKANEALSSEITYLAQNDPQRLAQTKIDLDTFLKDAAKSGAGAGGPSVVRRRTEYRPETIDSIISAAFQDLAGRGPTEEELKKYRSMAGKELAKPSSMGQTTYTNVNGTVQEQVTKEAFDPKEFLYSQIAGTNEARANKVFGFYNAFKKALGV